MDSMALCVLVGWNGSRMTFEELPRVRACARARSRNRAPGPAHLDVVLNDCIELLA